MRESELELRGKKLFAESSKVHAEEINVWLLRTRSDATQSPSFLWNFTICIGE